LLTKNM